MGLARQEFVPIRVLRDAYGETVELEGETGKAAVYTVLSEFSLGDRLYAVLQSERMKSDDDVALFRINRSEAGAPELETIMDDDEWEDVLELYDEMTFTFDDDE